MLWPTFYFLQRDLLWVVWKFLLIRFTNPLLSSINDVVIGNVSGVFHHISSLIYFFPLFEGHIPRLQTVGSILSMRWIKKTLALAVFPSIHKLFTFETKYMNNFHFLYQNSQRFYQYLHNYKVCKYMHFIWGKAIRFKELDK